jgi:hypothetical protein
MFGNKIENFMETYKIPRGTMLIKYLGGCFGNQQCLVFFGAESNGINLCEYDLKKDKPFFKHIPKDDIIAFSQMGSYSTNSIVSGGGVSLGGAAVGAVFLGPVGAVIGSHKKVKTQVQTTGMRKTIIKYKSGNEEKSFILDSSAYDILCYNFIEKKI